MSRHMSITGIVLLALGLSACGAQGHVESGPTPTAGATLTSLPMSTPASTPAFAAPNWPSFPKMCNITHSYWLKASGDKVWYYDVPSPDGKYVQQAQGLGYLLKETATGKTRFLVTGNAGYWSPQGDLLVISEETGGAGTTHRINLVLVDVRQGIDSLRRIALPANDGENPYILGWSPDEMYLAYVASPENPPSDSIMVWSVRDERIVYQSQRPYTQDVVRADWSPDSRLLAFFSHGPTGSPDSPQDYSLTTVDMATGDQVRHPVSGPSGAVDDQNMYGSSILWSPDSTRLALILVKWIALYRPELDGPVQAVDFSNMMVIGPFGREGMIYAAHFPVVSWQGDSRALMVWNHSGGSAYELDRVNVDPPKVEPVVTADQLPVFAPNDQQPYYYLPSPTGSTGLAGLAYTSGAKPHIQLNLIDPEVGEPVPLITGAADVGTPVWSLDFRHVAVVWTGADGSARLTWANARGNERYVLGGKGTTDIHDMSWSPDSQVLTLVGGHPGSYSVNMVDIGKGTYRVLLDGLSQAVYPLYNDAGAYLTVRWEMPSGQVGYDGFDRQGNRLFRVRVDGSVTKISQLFFSPDHQMVAVKVGPPGYMNQPGDERLVVARPDGSPPVILKAGLSGLGDPLWSPDSKLLAFTLANSYYGPNTWQVADTVGHILWTLPDNASRTSDPMVWNLVWTPCPP